MSSSNTLLPPAPSPRMVGRAGANTPATIGLVLGLVLALLALALDYLSLSNSLYDVGLGAFDNLLPVSVSVAAIVVGHIALARTRRFPPGRGRRGLAITAVALGYLSLIVFLAFIGLLLYAFFTIG
jgi:hypothetical protein